MCLWRGEQRRQGSSSGQQAAAAAGCSSSREVNGTESNSGWVSTGAEGACAHQAGIK